MSIRTVRRGRPRPHRAEPLEPRLLLATVSGIVFNDADADGVKDVLGEPGVANWTVYADLNDNGVHDASEPSDLTAAGGAYSLTVNILRPTTVQVRDVVQPTWRPTAPPDGANAVVLLSNAASATGVNFGNTQRALVTGTVFNDTNENGRLDIFERGLSGWTVFAANNNDGVLDSRTEPSATTDASGDYALDLPAGTHTIRQVTQPGWLLTAPAGGAHAISLTAGQVVSARHFGDVVATRDLFGAGFAVLTDSQPVPADGHVDVQYVINNDGTADTPSFAVGFYLSDDATITTSDRLIGLKGMTVPAHGAVTNTDTFDLGAPDPIRTDNEYYVGMIVDVGGVVAETDETNNANRGNLLDEFPIKSEQDLPRPADNANVDARPVQIGDVVTSALGDEWAGGYDMDVYRFTAQAGHHLTFRVTGLAGANLRLYNSSWALLASAQWASDDQSLPRLRYDVPANGTYYAVVSAGANLSDPRRLTGRTPAATGPYALDLNAENLDLHDPQLLLNGPAPGPIHVTLVLPGNIAFGESTSMPSFDTGIYLSDDNQFSAGDTFLTKVRLSGGDFRLPNPDDLNNGQFKAEFDISLPSPDPFRTDNEYWVLAVADSGDELPERHESNNVGGTSRPSELSLPSPVDGSVRLRGIGFGSPSSDVLGDEWIGPYDQDILFGTARPNETLSFDLDRTATTLDAYLRLYDGGWDLLASNDNAAAPGESAGPDPFLRYTFPAGGTYYVVLSGAGNASNDPRQLAGRSAASTGPYSLTIDYERTAPISGTVFDDSNNDGVRDPGEVGLAGRTVFLDTSPDGSYDTFDPSATTAADGSFTLAGVRPGTYYLNRVVPDGWTSTSPASEYFLLSLGSGQDAGQLVFGELRRPTVSGAVFDDANANGVRDVGEAGLGEHVVYADLNHNGVRDLVPLTFEFPGFPVTGSPLSSTVLVSGWDAFELADVNVLADVSGPGPTMDVIHRGASALLSHPSDGSIVDLHVSFDDEATFPLPPFSWNGRVQPVTPLSAFDGTVADGRWTLSMAAFANPLFPLPLHARGASLQLSLSEPFATTDANGQYTLAQLVPGTYTVRVEDEPDRLPTSPTSADHALVEAQADTRQDFGLRLRRLQVAARHVFYNNSAFDGRSGAIGDADDGAIAPDKVLLPAVQTPGAGNVTGYSKGINGVMVDVAELLTPPALSDFSFKVPSSFNPAVWLDAPTPTGFAVRDLPGGDHLRRVTFTWPDGLLRNTWLQVGVLANAATRRATPDLSYVGNLVGETGAGRVTRVDGADLLATRAAMRKGIAGVNNAFDFNRDGLVNVRDEAAVRAAMGHALPTLAPPAAARAATIDLPSRSPGRRTGWTGAILSDE